MTMHRISDAFELGGRGGGGGRDRSGLKKRNARMHEC